MRNCGLSRKVSVVAKPDWLASLAVLVRRPQFWQIGAEAVYQSAGSCFPSIAAVTHSMPQAVETLSLHANFAPDQDLFLKVGA